METGIVTCLQHSSVSEEVHSHSADLDSEVVDEGKIIDDGAFLSYVSARHSEIVMGLVFGSTTSTQ